MEEAFRTHLLATAGLIAIVGDRINWGLRPQGSPIPDVSLHLISDLPDLTLSGATHWNKARVQADSRAVTYKTARDIGRFFALPVAKGGLHGFRGTMSGIRFRLFVLDSDVTAENGTEGVVNHKSQVDLRILYSS
jgi:hypothetical protein